MSWTPHEMPFILEKAHQRHTDMATEVLARNPNDTALIAQLAADARLIDTPNLFWMDSDICELISTSGDVPEWSPESCIPADHGFMGLETPLLTCPLETADGDLDVPICGIAWETDGDLVRITAWAEANALPAPDSFQRTQRPLLISIAGIRIRLGTLVDATNPFLGDDSPTMQDAALALQSATGGLWLLMAQPTLVEETETVAKVRKKRGGVTKKMPVRVSTRSLHRYRPATSDSSGGTRGKATTRWWVRGHWRQQAWGKGRKLRKPIYIAPHTAGAQDAPVDKRPKVQVWRTGERE